MSDAWDEKLVFLRALELDPAARDEYLKQACVDASQRERIDALLSAHAKGIGDIFADAARTSTMPAGNLGGIDEFRLVERIGQGGMGVVYLAEDTVLGRRVAVKVLSQEATASEAVLGRFRDEARNAAVLNHPAIVSVYKFGFDGTRHYIVSEYVEGQTLAALIDQEQCRRRTQHSSSDLRDWHRRSAEIIATVADALDCSHRAGIIHRDVKPSNILIDNQRGPRLTDFGIAKHVTGDTQTLETGLVGSCHYMSPEQASIKAKPIDQRSDVFSLGVVLYEMLALERPFDGGNVHQILSAVIGQEPRRLRSINPRIPADLATICHKAIEKAPRDRYQSAAHVAADLRSYLAGDPILASPPTLVRRAFSYSRRHPKMTTGYAMAIVMVFATWFVGGMLRDAEDQGLAWVSLDTGDVRCLTYLQSFDDVTLMPEPELKPQGRTPISVLKLDVGQYRMTVVRESDNAVCEFNLVLRERGPSHQKRLLIHDGKTPYPSEATPERFQDVGQTLVGVFRPDSTRLAGMILVKGGQYDLSRETNAGEALAKPVTLDDFYIDERKVSNRDYAEFIAATGFRKPNFWMEDDPATILDLPVVGVTLEEAEAYARWRGKRLPTLHEWQAAVRGQICNNFPNGNAPPEIEVKNALSEIPVETNEAYQQRLLYMANVVSTGLRDTFHPAERLLQTYSNVRELCGTAVIVNASSYVCGRGWMDPLFPFGYCRQSLLDFPSPQNGFRCAAARVTK